MNQSNLYSVYQKASSIKKTHPAAEIRKAWIYEASPVCNLIPLISNGYGTSDKRLPEISLLILTQESSIFMQKLF